MEKFFAKMVVAALTFGISASASAQSDPIYVFIPIYQTNLGEVPVGETAFSRDLPWNWWFTDFYNFTLPTNSGSVYGIQNSPLSLSDGAMNTSFSSMRLYSNPDGDEYGGSGDETLVTSVFGNYANSLELSWGALAAGNYLLDVRGYATGSDGARYTGIIEVAAPVPEVHEWVMMVVGLGVVGMMLRKRRESGTDTA